ncbi:hypothetical protein NLU14_17015 [Marinobacter sp. 71-i]|uniref:Toxin CptA n=1 Tax=Marinobacter iranensis TaxID=2962607 RepID=A0ABT5YE40_9GAMM|nr:hypothetical protein [Marinobacter iranensis]MDF0751933.1 hypothetical protein [Marinobacter iranensis]
MSSRIELRLSPSHAVGLVCALPWLTLAVLVAALASEFGYGFLILFMPVLAGAFFQYRRNGLLEGPNAVTGLRIENGRIYACFGSGSEHAVLVASESRMGSRFAVLKLRQSGTISITHPVVLVTFAPWLCNTSPEASRRLRVWLRLGPSPGAKESGNQVQETQ